MRIRQIAKDPIVSQAAGLCPPPCAGDWDTLGPQGVHHVKVLAALTHRLPARVRVRTSTASGEGGRSLRPLGYGGGCHSGSEKYRLGTRSVGDYRQNAVDLQSPARYCRIW